MDDLTFRLLHAAVEEMDPESTLSACEGLTFFQSIDTAISKVFRAVRANVSRLGSEFKRSELQTYRDENSVVVETFFRNILLVDMTTLVAIPEGMVGTYDATAHTLVSQAGALDVKGITEKTLEFLKDVPDDITDVDACNAVLTKHADAIRYLGDLPDAKLMQGVKRLFGTSKLTHLPASRVFSGKAGIKKTYDECLKLDDLFHAAVRYKSDLGKVTLEVETILKRCEHTNEVSVKFTRALFTVLSGYTWMVDYYGVLLHEAQRTEHCFVQALRALTKATKK